MSVLLPAPFSPTRAWISPGIAMRSTPASARVSPNDLVTPRMASRGLIANGVANVRSGYKSLSSARPSPMNLSPPASPPPPNATTHDPNVDFHRELRALTPHVFVTHVLVALNVAVFAVMVASGVDAMNPTIESLLKWGADYAPRTLGGEPWRVLTATFIHIGIVHIGMNMLALYIVGPTVERLFGNVGYLVLYLAAGLTGLLVSIVASPAVVSAGASGAVFGLYGALLGFVLRNRGTIPPAILSQLARWALIVVGGNIVYGLKEQGIDMGAHLGGLAGGFLAGLLLAHPITREAAKGRWKRNLVLAVVTAVACTGALLALPRPADIQGEVDRFRELEPQVLDTFNADIERTQSGALSEGDFAEDVEKRVLPPWREERARLEGLRVSSKQAERMALIVRYMRAREDGWQLLVDGIRQNDEGLIKEAQAKQEEAQEVLKAAPP